MSLIINNQYNIGHICTKQQIELGNGDKLALRWLTHHQKLDFTYWDLENLSNKVANALTQIGVISGERVFIFTTKVPEINFCFLGILKLQAVAGILFSNFGEEALFDRLKDSQASILITKKSFLKKIYSIWPELPDLRKIIVLDVDSDISDNVLSYSRLMSLSSDVYCTPITSPELPSVLHYTSGSTGKPKGVLHVHNSILSQSETFQQLFGITDEDNYWCTADPGWVTGVSYGIIAPFSQGITQINYGGNYDPGVWFEILQNEKINVWYTAPTALRMLMQSIDVQYESYDLSCLRAIFSVGEPLNPAVIEWVKQKLNKTVYDTWFQTETGAIMISNSPNLKIKPGSMGQPFKGVEVVILDDLGKPVPEMIAGHLCLKKGWPSMFITYLNRQLDYNSKFRGDYYDTGDMAYKDNDGYFWFVGRHDDVINTAGHLVGPFEIESALLEIEGVAEAGVIGVPDELLYEKVIAYLSLKTGCQWTRELELKLRLYISNKVSSIATPQEFIVVDAIPKNKSGKIMRRVLKAWFTHQDIGDISTMEENL
jgi:acetyl-CoA synthetase